MLAIIRKSKGGAMRLAGCNRFFCWIMAVLLGAVLAGGAVAWSKSDAPAPGRQMAQQAVKDRELWITSDHTQHEILKQEFTSGPEVTQACLSCHNQAALQFHKTVHWTWMEPDTDPNAKLGKGGLSINNF
jgi:hypothetical protein